MTELPSSVAQEKKKSAFRTIGEVASDLSLPPHVLRFWESKFSQIKPHKRRGGHRYYRPADVEILLEVKSLLYERGYTIKGAQKYLKDANKNTDNQIPLFPLQNNDDNSINNDVLKKVLKELIEFRKLL